MRYAIIDLETDGVEKYGRFCNPLLPEHKIMISSIKYYDQDDVELIYNEEHYIEGIEPGEALGTILSRCDIIVGQNIKFDLLWLWGYQPLQDWLLRGGVIMDTQTIQYLLDGQDPYLRRDLDSLSKRYGGDVKNDLIGKLFKGKFTDNPQLEDALAGLKKNFGVTGRKIPTKPYYKFKHYKTKPSKWVSKKAQSPAFLAQHAQITQQYPKYIELVEWAHRLDICELIEYAALKKGVLCSEIPLDIILPYAVGDALNTEIVFLGQLKELQKANMGPLIDLYMRQYKMLIEMEWNGLYVNQPLAEQLMVQYTSEVDRLYRRLHMIADANCWPFATLGDFNPASNDDVSKLLFGYTYQTVNGHPDFYDGLRINPDTVGAELSTKEGIYKVGVDLLNKIPDCEFVDLLKQYRKSAKILNTYLQGNLALVHPDGLMHPEFKSTRTITGRLASDKPNAQNFEKVGKSLITSRFEGGQIISADFSQLEVICQAFNTQSANFIRDIEAGIDFHIKKLSYTVPESYEELVQLCAVDPVWIERRRKAKIITFRRAYGASVESIAEACDMDVDEVQAILDAEDLDYPEIKIFNDELMEHLNRHSQATSNRIPPKVKLPDGGGVYFDTENTVFQTKAQWQSQTGKIYTWFSFMTKYTKWNSVSKKTEWHEFSYYKPTQVSNYPTQGLAADIQAVQTGELFDCLAQYRQYIKVIAVVHDSIVFDVHPHYIDLTLQACYAILPNVQNTFKKYFNINFNVPLKIDIEIGNNWAEMEKVDDAVYTTVRS